MPDNETTSGPRNPLSEHLLGTLLDAAKANRADIEAKWNRNRALRMRWRSA